MLERRHYESREEWLTGREIGLGGSDAAAVVGMSGWTTPMRLWEEKRGIVAPKDISGNAAVERGNRMEGALRTMFAAMHPELTVEHHPYDMLYQSERPWLFATLDGEGVYGTGERCGIELKTCAPNGKAGWQEWSEGAMKQTYYVQVLHQLLATGFSHFFLLAALYAHSGDIVLREYEIRAEDTEGDRAWLLKREERFIAAVRSGTPPTVPLFV